MLFSPPGQLKDRAQTMEDPATASWGLSISDADFARLKRGVRARDMDDKWVFMAMSDEELAEEATASNAETTDSATANDQQTTDAATTDTEPTDDELMEAMLADEAAAAEQALADEAPLDLTQGANICIRRTWTSKEFYRLVVRPREGATSANIEAITWEQKQGDHISEEQAKIDVVILCRQILGCDFAAAPDYDGSLFSAFPRDVAVDSMTLHNGAN